MGFEKRKRIDMIKRILWTMWRCRKGVTGTLVVTMVTIWYLLATLNNLQNARFSDKNISISVTEFFHIKRDTFFNLHQYEYLHSSKNCENKLCTILIAIHSRPEYFIKRQTIRETFGSMNRIHNVSISTVFMLARVLNDAVQEQIDFESEQYGDIVQGNFIDSYANMTHKHVMLMHWVIHYCSHVQVIVKVDDDVFVNIFNLVSYIASNTIGIMFHGMRLDSEIPFRKPTEKYYIPFEMYPFDILPVYCPGLGYITTPEVFKKVYPLSRDVRYINMDDVFVTGILGMKAHINITDISDRMLLCRRYHRKSDILPRLQNLIFILNEDNGCVVNAYDIWRHVIIEEDIKKD